MIFISACGKKGQNQIDRKTQILAVNGYGLRSDFVKERFLRSQDFQKSEQIKPDQIKIFVEKFFLRDLYYLAEAYDQKLDQDSVFRSSLQKLKLEMLTGAGGALYKLIIPDSVAITNAELHDLYSKLQYNIRIAHIVVGSRQLADSLSTLIQSGSDFAQLARTYSIDIATRGQGGRIPEYLRPGTSAKAIENKAYSMRINQTSEPIKSVQGYHIIKLLEKQPEKLKSFAEEKQRLELLLQSAKVNAVAQTYIDSLFIRFKYQFDPALADSIIKSYSTGDDGSGILSLGKINASLHKKALVSFTGGAWTVADVARRYNEQNINLRVAITHTEDLEHIVTRLIVPELMYQDALRLKLDQSVEFIRNFDLITNSQLLNMLRVRMIEHQINPGDEEVEKYYNERRDLWKNQTFEKARVNVRNRLRDEQRDALEKKYLNGLYDKYEREYNDSLLTALAEDLTRMKKR
jgi:foldase protein PrsA